MTVKGARSRWQTIGTLVAGAGVILSLIFVGLELRQATQVARAQARQGLAERNGEIISLIAGSPELAQAWALRWQPESAELDPELSPREFVQSGWAMFGLLRHVENVYLQVVEGVVDESVLDSYGFGDNPHFATPQFAEYWRLRRSRFDPRFVVAFDAEYDLGGL
jgi:hypothetical protein